MPEPTWPWEAVTTDEEERIRARNAPVFYMAHYAAAGLMLYVAFREASPLWSPVFVALAIFLVIPRSVFSTLWKRLHG